MKILDNFVFIFSLSFSIIFSILNLEVKKKKKLVGLGENSIHHISNSLPLFQLNNGKHISLSFPFLIFHFPNS